MELLFDYTNVRKFRKIISDMPSHTTKILASIAFNTSEFLIDKALEKNIEMELWGLFDHNNSTRHNLIKKCLDNRHTLTFHPVKQNFHSKIIYFEGYGLYLGSANMTKKALIANIECGIFLDENDIMENNLLNQIEDYFTYLEKFPEITDEDYSRYIYFLDKHPDLKKIKDKDQENAEKEFNDFFKNLPFNDSPVIDDKDKKYIQEKKLNKFVYEWRETLNILKSLMEYFKTEEYYPKWIEGNPPKGILVDQMLHAFYYSIVYKEREDETSYEVCKMKYIENNNRKEEAIIELLNWWKNLDKAPSSEDIYLHDWAKVNTRILAKEHISTMSENDLIECYLHNHAARNHARQTPKSTLGFPDDKKSTIEECTIAFAKYHYRQKNKIGMSIIDLYSYVIYDNKDAIEVRINNALSDEYYIPHVGKSLLGEIVGWARPNDYPIRNNRVNKALFALGYEVKLFNK